MRTHRNCIVIVAVAAVLFSSSLSIGASVEVTGDFKVNGAGSGVIFPDGTVQTIAAAPTWHQILPASTRFVLVMGGVAVLDKETGLVWEQSPSTLGFYWEDAQAHCNELMTGGRLGWRIPTVQELASLVDPSQSNPALPSGHPFSDPVLCNFYWSATTNASNAGDAWVVSFCINGTVYNGITKTVNSQQVWCVRGGQGVNPQ